MKIHILMKVFLSEEILEDQKKNRIDHMTYLPGMEDIGSEILDQVVTAMEAYDYNTYTAEDVKRALAHTKRTPEDFQGVIVSSSVTISGRNRTGRTAGNKKTFWKQCLYVYSDLYCKLLRELLYLLWIQLSITKLTVHN